ncbi:MAG: hypothetical protein H0V70_26665 [Ktedonobacteraceae bacterium]|nr:hypothetical protein [Ktedonobacteraceae bacterium]
MQMQEPERWQSFDEQQGQQGRKMTRLVLSQDITSRHRRYIHSRGEASWTHSIIVLLF